MGTSVDGLQAARNLTGQLIHLLAITRAQNQNQTKPELKPHLTISFFSICQERWYRDNALLSDTHSQETLVHTRNQPANSHVGIVSSHPIMAKSKQTIKNPEGKTPQANVRQLQEKTMIIFNSHMLCTVEFTACCSKKHCSLIYRGYFGNLTKDLKSGSQT